MYFLTQFKFKEDGTVEKGTSSFDTEKEAIIQFHIALSSAMQKEDTSKFVALIIDENGKVTKREIYIKPQPIIEEVEEVTELYD